MKNIIAEINPDRDADLQIHEDVYSAEELLLQEAERILNHHNNGYNGAAIKRAEELASLGFTKSEPVKEYHVNDDDREEATILKWQIAYYQKKYPFNRFITEEVVEKICDKYGLFLVSASEYIGEIPERNQQEIINFRIEQKDVDSWARNPQGSANEKSQGRNFRMIAPEHKIDMEDKEKVGYVIRRKDPIVLQPVRGGYLVVTSWGIEAGDPEIINPINN